MYYIYTFILNIHYIQYTTIDPPLSEEALENEMYRRDFREGKNNLSAKLSRVVEQWGFCYWYVLLSLKKKPTESSESSTGESSWAIGNNYDGNKTMEVGGA